MKRDFLKDLNLSDEQIEKIMASNGYDVSEAIKKATLDTGKPDPQKSDPALEEELKLLRDTKSKYEQLVKEGMTPEERIKRAEEDAAAEKVKYLRLQSEATAKSILVSTGIDEAAMAKILPGIVTDDINATEKRAADYASVFSAAIDAAKKSKEEELLKKTPEPPSGTATPPDLDYSKKLDEARVNGASQAEIAYMIRAGQQAPK